MNNIKTTANLLDERFFSPEFNNYLKKNLYDERYFDCIKQDVFAFGLFIKNAFGFLFENNPYTLVKKRKTGEMLTSIDSNALFSFTFDNHCMPTSKEINFVIKSSLKEDVSIRKTFYQLKMGLALLKDSPFQLISGDFINFLEECHNSALPTLGCIDDSIVQP